MPIWDDFAPCRYRRFYEATYYFRCLLPSDLGKQRNEPLGLCISGLIRTCRDGTPDWVVPKNQRVAVITPVAADRPLEWIEAAWQSLASQVLPPGWSWSWFVWFDGLAKADVADRLAVIVGGDPRARALGAGERIGPNAARNGLLVEAAQYDLVTFLDDDDTLLEHSLARRIEVLQADPSLGWVTGGALVCDFDGTETHEIAALPEGRVEPALAAQVSREHGGHLPAFTGAWMCQTSMLIAAGGFGAAPRGGDVVGRTGVMVQWPGWVLHDPVYRYLLHADSVSNMTREPHVASLGVRFAQARRDAIEKLGVSELPSS